MSRGWIPCFRRGTRIALLKGINQTGGIKMTKPIGLAALEDRVHRDLELLAYPDKDWVQPVPGHEEEAPLDCAIVGGGQVGLSIAFGLKRERVNNIRIFDENPEGLEGPWATFARMLTLRTPKLYSGPEHGMPGLTFRAWYEAQFGEEGWQDLFRVPRKQWMEYLIWYRKVLDLPVTNNARLAGVEPVGNSIFRLQVERPEGISYVLARTVVIATGAAGAGENHVPDFISALPPKLWQHTNDAFDTSIIAGKRVGILGAGASAFDNAVAAVEAGAISADICFRRAELPRQNPRRFLEFSGFLAQYRCLPDAQKWQYLNHLYTISQPPPVPTYERAMSFQEISLRPQTPWNAVCLNEDGAITVETPNGPLTYDFLIAATGIRIDLHQRPELAGVVDEIALWRDHYTPPEALQNSVLAGLPYLGSNGELTEKQAGTAPWLKRIFMMNRGATLSLGPTIASNSALRYATPMVVDGVVRELFLDGADRVLSELLGREHDELTAEMISP